ncbi:MAG TPA: glutamate 5-kinase [Treponemataceae bacterium]|nr:glutamate 5-kinase [Treponemataceae bacterium]HOQ92023.1 glutamate 5-kinase [Treponemataceae bacterium]HPM05926.1 glutamate 5-kinase [Treponemataceae bacterium]
MSETIDTYNAGKNSCPTIQEILKTARKIVIKIGSNTLATSDGKINIPFMESFALQCASLMKKGKQIVIVSSGAQVAGLSTIDRWERKKDIHYRQALCAIGQVELMDNWRNAFWKNNIHIGQLLLTKDDFHDDNRTLNMRNTLFTLVDEGVIPIINENDSVSTEEIRIGDNDNLSALTAILWNADLLVLFSDIDGVYTDNPKTNPEAKLIEYVPSMDDLRANIRLGSANSFGTGGMNTKLEAADKLTSYGIPMILANGSHEKILEKLADGSQKATLFCAE